MVGPAKTVCLTLHLTYFRLRAIVLLLTFSENLLNAITQDFDIPTVGVSAWKLKGSSGSFICLKSVLM